ncbi:hypothetical protein CR513_18270, partial [Mucuna pruriens]
MSKSSGSSSARTTGSNRFHSGPGFRQNQQQEKRLVSESAEPALSRTANLTNLDRFLAAVTPSVPAQLSCEPRMKGRKTGESSTGSYFLLEDLWESFREWSAYGVEVPITEDGDGVGAVKMYYGPSLSAIQLYSLGRLSEDSGAESSNEISCAEQLVYEYYEDSQPRFRPPLHDKALSFQVSTLAFEFPSLKKYRSCDISPSSWFSVAWYPIYRIPVGSSLKRVDPSFLTFHFLSAHTRRKNQSPSHASSGRKVHGDGSLHISLPPFALASYKLRSSILAPNRDSEWQKWDSLLQVATDWLQSLQVKHPDYLYFLGNSFQQR